MDTQGFGSTFDGGTTDHREAGQPADAWVVQDRVAVAEAPGVWRHRTRRWLFVAGAFVLGAASSALLVVPAGRDATTASGPAAIPAAPPSAAAVSGAVGLTTPRARAASSNGRSLVLAMPVDRDYVSSTGVAVAGMAFARPHGPRIHAVRVDLLVAGSVVASADFDVFSARFAGVLPVPPSIGPAGAELRVSDPASPSRPAVIRSVTIAAPSSASTH